MTTQQALDTVFVELSVISPTLPDQATEAVGEVLNTIDTSQLFFNERTRNGACIEGEWRQIEALIHTCYERVHHHSPSSYLRITIR